MRTLCLTLFSLVALAMATAAATTYTCQMVVVHNSADSSHQPANFSVETVNVQFNLTSATPVVTTPLIERTYGDIFNVYMYAPTSLVYTIETTFPPGGTYTLSSTLFYFDEKLEKLANVTQNITSITMHHSSHGWTYAEHNSGDNEGNLWFVLSQDVGTSLTTDSGIVVFNATTRTVNTVVPFDRVPSASPVQVLTTVQGVSGLSYITADGPVTELDSNLTNVRIITYGVSHGPKYSVTYNVSLTGLPADMVPSAAYVTNLDFGEVVILALNLSAGPFTDTSGQFALFSANLYEDSELTAVGETRTAPKDWETSEGLQWNDGTAWWVWLFNDVTGEVRFVQMFNDGSTPNWYPKFDPGFYLTFLQPTSTFFCLPDN